MRFLLDTHALIWFVEGSKALLKASLQIIENQDNEIYISMVSFYEMAIKQKLNKLTLRHSLSDFYFSTINHDINILAIKEQHIFNYQNVPLFDSHRDPFDRLIIATAQFEDLTIITVDEQFNNYKNEVKLMW